LAFTELKFSNSMIEAWWRSLKHQWLFLHSLDSVTTVRRLVAFYVDEHNRVLPHSAFRGQTPDEMYFGTGDAVPADLTSRAAAARRARVAANRSASCEKCPFRLRDQRVLTVLPTTRTPRAHASGGEVLKLGDRTSHEWNGMGGTLPGIRVAARWQSRGA
jgi:putative transposase